MSFSMGHPACVAEPHNYIPAGGHRERDTASARARLTPLPRPHPSDVGSDCKFQVETFQEEYQ